MFKSKAGYVYVLTNPSYNGWHKVGRTQRTPYRRAKELSSAGVLTEFDIVYARFFWDCNKAESEIHKKLSKGQVDAKHKEFFNININEIIYTVKHHENPYQSYLDYEYLPLLFNWKNHEHLRDDPFIIECDKKVKEAHNLWNYKDAKKKERAISILEKLSIEGYAPATWTLGQYIEILLGGKEGLKQAQWVIDACIEQGVIEAPFKKSWIASHLAEYLYSTWQNELSSLWVNSLQHIEPQKWPDKIVDVLVKEVKSWDEHPDRNFYHPVWEKLFIRLAEDKSARLNWTSEREYIFKRIVQQIAIIKNKAS
jgi:hypothetical protein